nr:hypothetical protein [Kibdelosporangium sp. MJ126-NF4]CTQ90871.1 hypothetical protein [Kibdelosporangium sp. MJ126-NF4]
MSLALAFALNIARADMRQFLNAAARPLTRALDLTHTLDRASTLARANTLASDLDRALARALARAIARDLGRARARVRDLDRAIALTRARLVRARYEPDSWLWSDDITEYQIRSGIAAQGSALIDILALARDLAGDLDRDLDRASTLARRLDRAVALTRAHDLDRDLDRAIARDLGRARAIARDRDLARAHEFDLDRARCNFVGFDLRRVDLTGRSFDGVRWSSATQWPPEWANQIQRDSVEIEPGLFEIRPGAADASDDPNPLAEP